MIKNIRHTGIVVSNLEQGIKFYKQLGFKPSMKGVVSEKQSFDYYGCDRRIPWIKMFIEVDNDMGEHVIELYEIPGEDVFNGFNHISFTVSDINKAWLFFSKEGLIVSSKIIENNGHKLFFATDPWLNMLELVQK